MSPEGNRQHGSHALHVEHAGEWSGRPVDGPARPASVRALMIERTENQERAKKKAAIAQMDGGNDFAKKDEFVKV